MRRLTAVLGAGASLAAFAPPVVPRDVPNAITTVSREALDRLPAGRRLEDLLRTCPARTVPAIDRSAPVLNIRGLPPTPTLTCMDPGQAEMVELLRAHNGIRALYGSRPLFWDPLLAAQARSYGPILARFGRLVHSPRTGRAWSRENLSQSLRGAPAVGMMRTWIDERRYFRPGVFPDVSSTGSWYAVGHFTQMIWPSTTALGCAVQRGIGNFDWLICRYAPPGNRDGVRIGYPPPMPPPPPP